MLNFPRAPCYTLCLGRYFENHFFFFAFEVLRPKLEDLCTKQQIIKCILYDNSIGLNILNCGEKTEETVLGNSNVTPSLILSTDNITISTSNN